MTPRQSDEHGVESAVLVFVVRTLGVRRDRLTLNTTLAGDLGVDGDDADEFFAAFAAEFQVDLSAMNLSKHFGGEGYPFHFFATLVGFLLSGKTPEEYAGLIPITIGDLITAAKAGRWHLNGWR